MPSTIAWIDSTPEEQRAARELIALFTQTEGRDELGVGQIRDALSDLLFPGTSTLQTRARYFLFVPWCYTEGSAKGTTGAENQRRGEAQERRLVQALRDANLEDAAGLIGGRVGPSVKNLPSSIYWSGLQQYGILTHLTDPSHLGTLTGTSGDVATELAERSEGDWRPGIPPAPAHFPREVGGGFVMDPDEAEWLAARMTSANPNSVLATLLERRLIIDPASAFPWDEAPRAQFEELDHAYWFSNVFHGASLLYNLLVAERYDANPALTRIEYATETYLQRLDDWAAEFLVPLREGLLGWDIERLWQLVLAVNPNINRRTQSFVETWLDEVRTADPRRIAENTRLRQLVQAREQRKGKQSRLFNDRLVATWSGASGAGQLDFRWGTVRTLVNDIVRGMTSDAGATK
jgi:hypothetical protein